VRPRIERDVTGYEHVIVGDKEVVARSYFTAVSTRDAARIRAVFSQLLSRDPATSKEAGEPDAEPVRVTDGEVTEAVVAVADGNHDLG
jgi:hypothetical protein